MRTFHEKVSIFGLEFDNLSYDEVLRRISSAISKSNKMFIVTPYSEIIIRANKHAYYKAILNKADLVLPDGMGVVVAARLMGTPLRERITGIDLSSKLIDLSSREGHRVFFLGGKDSALIKLSEQLVARYPVLEFNSYSPPFKDRFSDMDNNEMIERINRFRPNILFVAFGPPKQEEWLVSNLQRLDVNVALAVGGTFDFLVGDKKRAPLIIQKLCLEWLYRLVHDPNRLRRQLVVPIFIAKILSLVFVNKQSKVTST